MVNNIRALRKNAGLTMKQLGAVMGVSESTISLYETGKNEPDISMLKRMSEYFGVSIDTLLGCDSFANAQVSKKQPPAVGEELDPRVRDLITRLNLENTEKMIDYAELLLTSQEK